MGIDAKYGRVTLERGTIGEDEPVVVFRAQDKLLPVVLQLYRSMCAAHGSPDHHLDGLRETECIVRVWQAHNHTQTPCGTRPAPGPEQPSGAPATDPGDLPRSRQS